MAAMMNARRDKYSTVYFTLPISCQICLGKVKQPVLCPNNHAFCSPCMDIWLQNNQQCPACRIPINHSNPIKQIKGGLNQTEDIMDKLSTSNLRKARFELLYKEYEDEYDRLDGELKVLRMENEVLKSKAAKDAGKTGVVSERSKFVHPDASDASDLLAVTKKLQGAQKLYEHLKSDMSKVKEENNRLRDENVNLNRENEKLRSEVASRSPHRYGRYTVATLEAKIECYEKEIRQLNKALARSDKYVDDLEVEMNQLKGINPGRSNSVPPKSSSLASDSHLERQSIDLAPIKGSISKNNPAKRQLFGSSMDDLRSLSAENARDRNSEQEREFLASEKFPSQSGNSTRDVKSKPHKGGERKDLLVPDMSRGKVMSPMKDKSPKKVHFSLPKDSFDLDKPSPLNLSSSVSSVRRGRSSPSDIDSRYFVETKYDSHPLSRTGTGHVVDGDRSVDTFEVDDRQGKSVLKTSDRIEDSSNLSHLSVPGIETTPTKRIKHGHDLDMTDLDDTQTIRSELDDLNISLTPELSDCLKLLNRAEKKSHIYEGTDAFNTDYPRDIYSSHSAANTESTVRSYPAQTDMPLRMREHEYYSKVNSNSSKTLSAGSHVLESGTGKNTIHSVSGTSQPDYHSSYPTSSLSSSYPLPSYTTIPVSASVGSSQSRGTSAVQNIDDKLLELGISGISHGGSKLSNMSSYVTLPSKPGSAKNISHGSSSLGSQFTEVAFHSSLPTTNTAAQSCENAFSTTGSPLPNPSHRRSSLDYGKTLYRGPLKTSGQNLLVSQTSGRKYSSLTNIPANISTTSVSALSNYSQTVGSHLSKFNQHFPTSNSSSLKTMSYSSGGSQTLSFHPSYSLSLTGGPPTAVSGATTVLSGYTASSATGSSNLLPASSSLYSSSLPTSSFTNTAYTSTSFATSFPRLSSEDRVDTQASVSDMEKRGNYSYVSNASNELSSRGSDSFLPEPKKRLFESGDDLDLTLSPIKSTRIS